MFGVVSLTMGNSTLPFGDRFIRIVQLCAELHLRHIIQNPKIGDILGNRALDIFHDFLRCDRLFDIIYYTLLWRQSQRTAAKCEKTPASRGLRFLSFLCKTQIKQRAADLRA